MKIVFLSGSAELGGAERSLLDLLEALRVQRPDWTLRMVSPARGPLPEAVSAAGVGVLRLDYPAALARLGEGAGAPRSRGGGRSVALLARIARALPATRGYVRELGGLLERERPDLVHSNGNKMHVLAARSAPAGVPLVWHIRDYPSGRPFMAGLLRRHAGRCSLALANSSSVADDVRAVLGESVPIRAVLNGVDLDRFSPAGERADLDGAAGLGDPGPGVVRVGLVATMAPWKGHEVFLRALAAVPRELPVRGYVVGGEIYAPAGAQRSVEELRGVARRLGLEGRVGFTGFLPDPAAVMRALDVVVHASTEPEPFGRVIAEAMACGRAVVTSAVGGGAELVRPDVDALVFRPGHAGQLAAAMERLVASPGARAELGALARRTAEARFDRRRVATATAGLLGELARRAAA